MSQYENLFNSTRIPDSGMDRLETKPDARHIAVISRGEIYTFDAIDEQVRRSINFSIRFSVTDLPCSPFMD